MPACQCPTAPAGGLPCRGSDNFTSPLEGEVDPPTGPARSGRPDDKLRGSGGGPSFRTTLARRVFHIRPKAPPSLTLPLKWVRGNTGRQSSVFIARISRICDVKAS